MAHDDDTLPPRGYTTTDVNAVVPERKSFRRRHRGKLLLAGLILIPVLLFALWTAITLAYTYSSGDRTGYLRKFSKKGWLCKTWEGQIALASVPGTVAEPWDFTVRDDAVARRIQALEGKVTPITLHYEQHKGVPLSCFGETEYFVTDARAVQ